MYANGVSTSHHLPDSDCSNGPWQTRAIKHKGALGL